MGTVQEDIARKLRRSKEFLQMAQKDVEYYEKDIAKLVKQRDCSHANTDGGTVFGTVCKDCFYFFNDGF